MEDLLKSAGQKGVSAVVERIEEDCRFRMQFRAGSIEQLERLRPALQTLSLEDRQQIGPLGFVWQVGFLYCPWCGASLVEWIDAHKSLAIDLAEQHKSLVL